MKINPKFLKVALGLCHLPERIDGLLLEMWSLIALSPFEERRFTPPYPIRDQTSFEIRQSLVYFEFEFIMVFKNFYENFFISILRTVITQGNYWTYYWLFDPSSETTSILWPLRPIELRVIATVGLLTDHLSLRPFKEF